MKPKVISWIIDRFCNLACDHCYADSLSRPMSNLSRLQIEEVCRSISTIKPEVIVISGGECTLNPNIFTYLNKSRKSTSGKLWICSNGTATKRDMLSKIRDCGVDGFSISLDHANEYVNDDLRGKGSTKKILSSISKLKDFGFDVIIDVTLMKINIDCIDNLFDLAYRNGISNISFTRFRPIGRGKKNASKFLLTREDNYTVLRQIAALSFKYENILKVSVHDPVYDIVLFRYSKEIGKHLLGKRGNQVPGCKAGINWIGIDQEGNASPCPLLLQSPFIIGNVLKNELSDILEKSSLIAKIKERRNMERGCVNNNICGCCLADTYAQKKNLFLRDPKCIEYDTLKD